MQCLVHDLGLVDYKMAWQLQARLAEEIGRGQRPPTLLLLEHPHTFTLGRAGQAAHLLWDEQERARRGVQVHWVDRGGDITYHGPGQLVGYPLIPLGPLNEHSRLPEADYVGYVRRLERALISALARLGLACGQLGGLTGVWIQPDVYARCARCLPSERGQPAKIAAIGVKVDARGVTRHGFALNVAPDMSYWQGIIACGLPDHPLASLADLLDPLPDLALIKHEVTIAFGQVFGFEMKAAEVDFLG